MHWSQLWKALETVGMKPGLRDDLDPESELYPKSYI